MSFSYFRQNQTNEQKEAERMRKSVKRAAEKQEKEVQALKKLCLPRDILYKDDEVVVTLQVGFIIMIKIHM